VNSFSNSIPRVLANMTRLGLTSIHLSRRVALSGMEVRHANFRANMRLLKKSRRDGMVC